MKVFNRLISNISKEKTFRFDSSYQYSRNEAEFVKFSVFSSLLSLLKLN